MQGDVKSSFDWQERCVSGPERERDYDKVRMLLSGSDASCYSG